MYTTTITFPTKVKLVKQSPTICHRILEGGVLMVHWRGDDDVYHEQFYAPGYWHEVRVEFVRDPVKV
jgi:hypothetical protein